MYGDGIRIYESMPNMRGLPPWIAYPDTRMHLHENSVKDEGCKKPCGKRTLKCPECNTPRPTVGITFRSKGTWEGIACAFCKTYVNAKGWLCHCDLLWYMCKTHAHTHYDPVCKERKQQRQTKAHAGSTAPSNKRKPRNVFRYGRMPGDHTFVRPAEFIEPSGESALRPEATDEQITSMAQDIRATHIEHAFLDVVESMRTKKARLDDSGAQENERPQCGGDFDIENELKRIRRTEMTRRPEMSGPPNAQQDATGTSSHLPPFINTTNPPPLANEIPAKVREQAVRLKSDLIAASKDKQRKLNDVTNNESNYRCRKCTRMARKKLQAVARSKPMLFRGIATLPMTWPCTGTMRASNVSGDINSLVARVCVQG